MATVAQEISALYSAIFSRAPDKEGLDFWTAKIDGGASLADAAEGFTQHPVFTQIYQGLSDTDFVSALYVNILGSAGDTAGVQFWVDRLAGGATKGQVVADFVTASLDTDLNALLASGSLTQAEYDAAVVRQNTLTNKADVGVHFANTYGASSNLSATTDATTKEGLESDPNYLASQAILTKVTADIASVAAANALIDSNPIASIVDQTFTLTKGLEDLSAANAAKADFLTAYAQDPQVDGVEPAASEADVKADLDAAVANVDALVAGDYTTASTNVRAALLADQKDANAKVLAADQQALTKAQADVAAVAGLSKAVADLTAAQDATTAATDAVTQAQANVAAAVAAYQVLSGAAVTVNADGTVAGLITLNKGALVLANGVTETTNKGVTALLNASIAKEAADKGLVSAQAAQEAAQKVVNDLDLTDTAKADLQIVADHMTVVSLADGVLPTAAQISSEIAGLQKLVQTAQASADLGNAAQLRADATAAADADIAAQTDAAQLRADATAAADADIAAQTDAVQQRTDANTAAQAVTDFGNLINAYNGALVTYTADSTTFAGLQIAYGALTTFDPVSFPAISDTDGTAIATADAATQANIATEQTTLATASIAADAAATAAETADATAAASLTASSYVDAAAALAADATAADAAATAAETADATAATSLAASSYVDAAAALAADATAADAAATAAETADTAVTTAQANLNSFQALVGTYDAAAAMNPRLTALTAAEDAISNEAKTGIQDQIEALNKAVADLDTAQANSAELASLNDHIAAAEKAFADNDLQVPVTLAGGANLATAESDIFLVGTADSSIANFGLLGNDALYIGKEFTLNTGDFATAGNNSVLEAFLSEDNSGNAVVTLETQPWGSNSADAEIAITLTGVSAADVTVADGFVTVA